MDSELYDAAVSGDVDFLDGRNGEQESSLLSQLTPKKNTVLHIAAEFNKTEFLKKVFPKCPSLIWQTNSKGETPLHVAARMGSQEIVEFFIASAQLVSRPDIETGRDKTLEDLLKMWNAERDTVLHCAIRNGCFYVVNALIDAYPELRNFGNGAHESPLYLAAAECPILVDSILGHSAISSSHKGPNGMTPMHPLLHWAQSQDIMKKLVQKSPQMIREGDNLGRTPLHYAAHWCRVDAVEMFLGNDSSAAYILDHDGESALHIAAFLGHINVMKKLLQCHPDTCELIDERGRTALHAAVLGGRENVVRYVLGNPKLVGLINEQDNEGNTPLHLAALIKRYNIIIKLASDKRVNIDAKNKEFRTAFDIYEEHEEGRFMDRGIRCLLERSRGAHNFRLLSEKQLKVLKESPIEENSSINEANTEHQRNSPQTFVARWRNLLEMQQVMAILIATVTFAAAFTLPGGYKSDGTATLQGKAAFKAFVVFNTIAFAFSVLAVCLQTRLALPFYNPKKYMNFSMASTHIALLGMVPAFACGLYAVLENSTGLAITAFVVFGCIVVGCHVGGSFWDAFFEGFFGESGIFKAQVKKINPNLYRLKYRYFSQIKR